jgi:hypothetical protein
MDAWTERIVAAMPTLPEGSLPRVVDVEPGSTWVQGVGSDPYKIRRCVYSQHVPQLCCCGYTTCFLTSICYLVTVCPHEDIAPWQERLPWLWLPDKLTYKTPDT